MRRRRSRKSLAGSAGRFTSPTMRVFTRASRTNDPGDSRETLARSNERYLSLGMTAKAPSPMCVSGLPSRFTYCSCFSPLNIRFVSDVSRFDARSSHFSRLSPENVPGTMRVSRFPDRSRVVKFRIPRKFPFHRAGSRFCASCNRSIRASPRNAFASMLRSWFWNSRNSRNFRLRLNAFLGITEMTFPSRFSVARRRRREMLDVGTVARRQCGSNRTSSRASSPHECSSVEPRSRRTDFRSDPAESLTRSERRLRYAGQVSVCDVDPVISDVTRVEHRKSTVHPHACHARFSLHLAALTVATGARYARLAPARPGRVREENDNEERAQE